MPQQSIHDMLDTWYPETRLAVCLSVCLSMAINFQSC